MRTSKLSISIGLMLVFLLVTALPALSASVFPPPAGETPAKVLGFGGCSKNNVIDTLIGETQFFVDVYPWGTNPIPNLNTQALFVIRNTGPTQVVIADVYFDDGVLLGISGLYDKDDPAPTGSSNTGVDFSIGASPPNLPSPNCVVPPFGKLVVYSADADPSGPKWGIGPGEILGVVFNLQPTKTFGDLLAGLNSGIVRIGLHAIAYASGGSESFVSKNATAITLDTFSAQANRGKVTLNWKTGTEINNAGFNVYRSSGLDGARSKVNGGIIAAAGEAVSGASYRFADAPGYGVFYYWLEDVEFTGIATLHGPLQVTVTPSFGRPMYRPVLPGSR